VAQPCRSQNGRQNIVLYKTGANKGKCHFKPFLQYGSENYSLVFMTCFQALGNIFPVIELRTKVNRNMLPVVVSPRRMQENRHKKTAFFRLTTV
jgi:hypothetical protein